MNKRTVALGLVAVFAVTTVAAVVLAITGGDDGGEVAGATTTTTATLSDTARELVGRLEDARKRPLHLVYSGSLVSDPDAGKLIIEIWWDGERARQDFTTDNPQFGQKQSSFALPSGNVTCLQDDADEWKCQRSASAATASGRPAGIIEALVAQLNGRTVTEARAKVGDTDADCYTVDQKTGDVVCLRDDGVPVKFTLRGSELLVTSVDSDVKDGDFTPPAEPTELPATPATPTTEG